MTVTYKIYRAQHRLTEKRMMWLLKFEGDNADCATFDEKFAPSRVRHYADCTPERIEWLGGSYWDDFAAFIDAELVARWTVSDSWFRAPDGTEDVKWL